MTELLTQIIKQIVDNPDEVRVNEVQGERSIWRYADLLPLDVPDGEPPIGPHVGFTPLVRARNLAREWGVRELYVKNDAVCHPTCSFKDRVVAVAVAKAREFGFDTVACASTGNLANSVAAHAAEACLAGIKDRAGSRVASAGALSRRPGPAPAHTGQRSQRGQGIEYESQLPLRSPQPSQPAGRMTKPDSRTLHPAALLNNPAVAVGVSERYNQREFLFFFA